MSIPPEEHNSVDELMVSFKGKSPIKQYIYMQNQTHGGSRCGEMPAYISGILYDFYVYQGPSKANPTELGVGGDIVMKLTESLEGGRNF